MSVATAEPLSPSVSSTAIRWFSPPLAAAFALHLVFLVVAWMYPPAVNSDSATGFLVWESWQRGAAFNHVTVVDPADISRDRTYFQAWWSPGQYLIVAPWQWLGLSLGQAIAVGGFVITALGLWGYARLFLRFGFDRVTCGWAVLAVACNWTLTRTYGDYVGGEPALLAVLPWVALGLRAALAQRWSTWLSIPALCWVGSMAKLSFPPVAAGLIAGFRGEALVRQPLFSATNLRELARWAGWFGLGQLLVWATYLRWGPNPTASHAGENHPAWWIALPEILAFPVTSVFSLGSLASRIFLHPSQPLLPARIDLAWLFAGMSLWTVPLLIWILRREWRIRREYARVLVGVLAAYTGFFLLVVALGSATGLEDRYFKPAGFLLLPGIVACVIAAKPRFAAVLLGGALVLSCLYGVAAVANRARHLARLDNVGRRGITHNVVSREGLRVLHALDDSLPRDALIAVPSPEMALELMRVRRLATHAIMMPPEQLAGQPHRGRTPEVIVVVNQAMRDNGKAEAWLRGFADYPFADWRVHRHGEWFFYHQGNFTDWPRATP